MRGFTLACALGAFLGAISFASADDAMPRPSGQYQSVRADNERACANACAADTLCMAWALEHNTRQGCHLYAIAPDAIHELGASAGFSARAPIFVQQRAELERAHRYENQTMPAAAVREDALTPAQLNQISQQSSAPDEELLGAENAPAPQQTSGLRPRFSSSPN